MNGTVPSQVNGPSFRIDDRGPDRDSFLYKEILFAINDSMFVSEPGGHSACSDQVEVATELCSVFHEYFPWPVYEHNGIIIGQGIVGRHLRNRLIGGDQDAALNVKMIIRKLPDGLNQLSVGADRGIDKEVIL
jgi:hypothetical protein